MQGFPTPYARPGFVCQYTHASNFQSAWIQYRLKGQTTWTKAGPEAHDTAYNTQGIFFVTQSNQGCVSGNGTQFRSHIARIEVKTSSGALVHAIYNANGPIYTC
jgi:hypothetical protein